MSTTQLGGRLPLLDPASLTSEQKAVYECLTGTMVKWADASGFQSITEDGQLIGSSIRSCSVPASHRLSWTCRMPSRRTPRSTLGCGRL